MSEENRIFHEFKDSYNRLEELVKKEDFLQKQIDMFGGDTTLSETIKRVRDEYHNLFFRMRNYFKEKENKK